MKPVPGAKKVGDHCNILLRSDSKTSAFNYFAIEVSSLKYL